MEKDLTGQKIGMLTLLKRIRENNRTYYYCKCECGNNVTVRADSLSKNTKSCGCLSRENLFKAHDISNRKFGRLTALSKTENRDKNTGSVIWKCVCECSNIAFISEPDLVKGKIRSCGCLSIENSKKNIKNAIKKHLEEHIIEGTNLQIISRTTVQSNNTSGFTGVVWDKSRDKWKAEIRFKKKLYSLGRFDSKDDAIKARKLAEDKLFGEFLEWYKEFKKKKESNYE